MTNNNAKTAQEERSKKYGIAIREGGSVTKPAEYNDVPDSEFADPVNYAYPLDKEHVMAAYKYFAKPDNQGEYSAEEKAKIWKRYDIDRSVNRDIAILKEQADYLISINREFSKREMNHDLSSEIRLNALAIKELLK